MSIPPFADMALPLTYHASRIRYHASCLSILGFLVCPFGPAFSQVQPVEGSNFKVADLFDPPNERQIRSLIQGARWRHEGAQTAVYDAKVQTFSTNGAVELIIEAPECFHDENRKAINSSGPVKFRTADSRFSLSGVGFAFLQTNSTLYISNQVQTVVLSQFIDAGTVPEPTNATAPAKGVTVISDRFEYSRNSGIGIYSGNVRALGTNVNFKAKSDVMEVFVPEREHQLQTITISQKVALDYESVEATGDKAVYTAATGLAKITGLPAVWHDTNRREGRADELTIDRTNKTFRADGQARVKMPAQNMGGPNAFLSSTTNSTAGTNQFVEIFSDYYQFRTNAVGNLAQFGEHVRMIEINDGETNGTLTAAAMLVTIAGTNELQSMVAEKNVIIQNDENQFTGQKAVYTATNAMLELSGNPAWRAGPRDGKGDLILVDLKQNKMQVLTNAYMRVPANQLGPTAALAQGSREPALKNAGGSGKAEATPLLSAKEKVEGNFSPLPPVPEERPRRTNPSTLDARASAPVEFAEIFSERYTVATNTTHSEAHFAGGVRIVHPRLNWVCQTMNVASPNTAGREVTMNAEQAVEFNLKAGTGEDQLQNVHGACNRAVYNYAITPVGTNDTMTLTGNSILQTTNGVFKNEVIVLDCANNKLMARGPYRIYGTNATVIPTNAFRLPSPKKKK